MQQVDQSTEFMQGHAQILSIYGDLAAGFPSSFCPVLLTIWRQPVINRLLFNSHLLGGGLASLTLKPHDLKDQTWRQLSQPETRLAQDHILDPSPSVPGLEPGN